MGNGGMFCRMLTNNSGLVSALDEELIAYLTTVTPSGQPKTSPIWFMRDDEDLVMWSRPGTLKLSNIESNPKVGLTLRGDAHGHSFALIDAVAAVDPELPDAKDFPGLVDKYGEDIAGLGWTPESFGGDYSVGVRFSVTKVRARIG